MATLNIEGRKVTVDDSFLKLSPDEQQQTVDEIASTIAKPDKYQQAATEDIQHLRDIGAPIDNSVMRRLAHGVMLGADNTLVAGAFAPIEAYKRGVGLGEGYNYAKAREDQLLNDARANTGIAGTAAELLGGGVAGGGLAKAGLTTGRWLSSAAPGLLGRTASSAADAATLGGVAGFNEGNGISDRLNKAREGAIAGGLIGGALPLGGAAVKGVVSPFLSNILAQVDPQGYGRRQVARAIVESGQTPDQIGRALHQAASEGQGAYTVADALGNSGQRMLSAVARAPGEGRTAVVNALEARQANQGRRVSNALAEGFDAPETAAQMEARLTAARDDAANAEYGAVRTDAQPVDVSNVIAHLDQQIAPYGVAHDIASPDSITGALAGIRRQLANDHGAANDFNLVQRIRQEVADSAQNARQSGHGNRARILGGVVRQLDQSLENASQGYLQANRNFAQATRDIEAVQAGRQAATRGRSEDVIPAYQALSPEAQTGYRSGYVDPLIAQTEGAAFGVNKARPFTNDAFAAEAQAMAPGNAQMQRRLGREMTMFETRNTALGGSKTADNLADADALGIDPSVVGHVLHGNYGAAVSSLIHAGSRAVTGNTPRVRQAVADLLLRNGTNVTPAQLDQMVGETVRRIQFVQDLARGTKGIVAGAIATAPNATKKPKPSVFKRAS